MTKYSLRYHYAALMYRYMATHKIDRHDKMWDDMVDYIIDNYPQGIVDEYVNDPSIDGAVVKETGEKGVHEMLQKASSLDENHQDSTNIDQLVRAVIGIRITNIVNDIRFKYSSRKNLKEWDFTEEVRGIWFATLYEYLQDAMFDPESHAKPSDAQIIMDHSFDQSFIELNVATPRLDEEYVARHLTTNRGDLKVTPVYKELLEGMIENKIIDAQTSWKGRQSAMISVKLYGWDDNGRLHLLCVKGNSKLGLPRNARILLNITKLVQDYLDKYPVADNELDIYYPSEKEIMDKINKNIKNYVVK